MKYICKDTFKINDMLIGNKGDILEIIDAIPQENETLESVKGYCDIKNLNTNQLFNSTWMDIDDTLETIERMCYFNTQPIQHGTAVMVQKKSLNCLKKTLEMMRLEPIAFEAYIPEIEHLIAELSQEDYKSNSKTWK